MSVSEVSCPNLILVTLIKSNSLAQVGHRSFGCSVPGSGQGQVGKCLGQPGIVEGTPAHGRALEQDDL